MRAHVFVDGFNFYYRRLKRSHYKWLNLKVLADEVLQPSDNVQSVKYFTADVSPRAGDPDAPKRQETYFRALKTVPEITIHKGKFLPKEITRPLIGQAHHFVDVHDTEEKGADVNLASHLLMDAFKDAFDVALILSQDTDLLEPIRMVTEELGKDVIVLWFDGTNPGKRHRRVASSIKHLHNTHLRNAQFPSVLVGKGGAKIEIPDSWKAEAVS